MHATRPTLRATAIAAALFLAGHGLPAGAVTWDGGGASGNWNSVTTTLGSSYGATNWSGPLFTLPGNGDSLVFAGSTRLNNNNNLLSTVNNLSFADTAGAFTLGGDGLTVNGAVNNLSSRLQTINLALKAGPALRTWDGGTAGMKLGGGLSFSNGAQLELINRVAVNGGTSFVVGDGAQATLWVRENSSVSNFNGSIGKGGGRGVVEVSGGGSWTSTGGLFVSADVTGTTGELNVDTGGRVATDTMSVAQGGRVTAGQSFDPNSALPLPGGRIHVVGELALRNGGQANSSAGYVSSAMPTDAQLGIQAGSVLIRGAGSTWETASHFTGYSGTGTTNVEEGGKLLTLQDTHVGHFFASSGRLNVNAGGEVQTLGDGVVGTFAGSTGAVKVEGTRAQWWVRGDLFVGGSRSASGGAGTVTVISEGTLTASNLTVWNGASSVTTGTTAFSNGGVIDILGDLTLRGGGKASSLRGVVDINHAGRSPSFDSTIYAGHVVINEAGSRWDTGTLTVAKADRGSIVVTDGGAMATSGHALIGAGAASIGQVRLGGANARWDVAGTLFVGGSELASGGTGGVIVESGGSLKAGNLTVWNGRSWIQAGTPTSFAAGVIEVPGALVLSGGGKAASLQGLVGYAGLETPGLYANRVDISGSDSNGPSGWDTGSLYVGHRATGSVAVANGAYLSTSIDTLVGTYEGGHGTLNVNAGGFVNTGRHGILGYSPGSSGTVNVSGPGALWDMAGNLYIGGGSTGNGGAGALTVSNSAVVQAQSLTAWNNTSSVTVNSGGRLAIAGALALKGGAQASTYYFIADNAASSRSQFQSIVANSADVRGAGSRVQAGALHVGKAGNGVVTVGDGGLLSSLFGYVGYGPGSNGLVTLDGPNARWEVANGLHVGLNGMGVLTLLHGGGAQADHVTVGPLGSVVAGTATSAVGDIVDIETQLWINGGRVTSRWGWVDNGSAPDVPGSVYAGTALVSANGRWDTEVHATGTKGYGETSVETGGTLNATQRTLVGVAPGSFAVLTVGSGGRVLTPEVFAGLYPGSAGEITVGGAGARMDVAQDLWLGGNEAAAGGAGQLIINAGGTVAAGRTTVWQTGTLIMNGGQLQTATLHNHGLVRVAAGAAGFAGDVVHNGTGFDVLAGAQAVFLGRLSGAGRFTGPGELVMQGQLAPGNSPALMTVEGNMTLLPSSSTQMELGGRLRGAEYDALDVGGAIRLGGTLELVFLDLGTGLFNPQAGDSFDLVTADQINGSYDRVSFAALAPGLAWNLAYLPDAQGNLDVLRLSVSAVPEVETYLMMLAGLAAVGAVSRRRLAARD